MNDDQEQDFIAAPSPADSVVGKPPRARVEDAVDPDETPRNDPIALKCSRPTDPVQDPDPTENSVARPTGRAGAELLLTAAAAARDVEESTDEGVALATPGEATVLARTDQPENARQKKKRKQKRGASHRAKRNATSSQKHLHKPPKQTVQAPK